MSAPILWIVIPLTLSGFMLFFLQYSRLVKILGIVASLILALIAIIQPIGNVLNIGNMVIDISPAFFIFGRSLLLENADRFALSLVYTTLLLFLLLMDRSTVPAKFVPLSMAVSSLLIAALAVQPFLYSAVLVELAVLLIVLMVHERQDQPVTGIMRFLVNLTLAMPGILFAGWLLGGSQATATVETKMMSAVMFLMFGFSIWLSVFPFHSWMPQFSQAINPFTFSFIFSVFPVITMLVIMKYISGVLWLRSSEFLSPTFQIVGVIMIVTTGIFASVEKDLKRFLAYTVLLETGFALTILSLRTVEGVLLLYEALIPRILSLALFGYSLLVLGNNGVSLSTDGIRGVVKKMPFASIGVLISLLTVLGFPLFAGFPIRLELMNLLGQSSATIVLWIIAGLIGGLVVFIRIFVQFASPGSEKWEIHEKITQVILISLIVILLIFLGLFPGFNAGVLTPFLAETPVLW